MWNFPLFPDRASSLATRVDVLFFAWLALATLVALAVAVLIVFFSIKYRRGSSANRAPAPEAVRARRDRRIELAWIFVPLGVFFRPATPSTSTSWASSGCGSSSTPAASARSTSFMCPQGDRSGW